MDLQVDFMALTSGPEPPIMNWYSHKSKQIFMNAHKCVYTYRLLSSGSTLFSLAIKP